MELATAVTAGTLAVTINTLTSKIAGLNTYIANGATLDNGNLLIHDPITGNHDTVAILPQTVSESADVFNSMITILQGRLNTANAQLAAL